MLIEQPWGQQKPPYGTKVNGKHELLSAGGSVWLFNEGAGATAYDDSQIRGTLNGSFKWNPTIGGVGLVCDGSTVYGETTSATPNIPLGVSGTFLLSFIITAYPGSGIAMLANQWDQTNSDRWVVNLNTNGTFFTSFHTTGSNTFGNTSYNDAPNSSSTLSLNKLYQIAIVRSTTTFTYYVNGQLDSTHSGVADSNPYVASACSMRFGAENRGGWPRFFDGTLLQLSILPRALSYAEIQQLYASPYCFMQPRQVWMPEVVAGGGAVYLTRRTQEGFGARVGSRKVAA